jgi:AcrR family transcriptional regulator/DNA-binding MarR family transcriptional regulator
VQSVTIQTMNAPAAGAALDGPPAPPKKGLPRKQPSGGRGRSARQHVSEAQRIRILSAIVDLECPGGAKPATVSQIVGHAGVSRNTFYALFKDRGECLLAAMEHALELAQERALAAYDPAAPWAERVRAGLFTLLQFFDEEPKLARLCVVQSANAGPDALARRWEVLDRLARLVDEGRESATRRPPPLTAEGVVGGALSLVQERMLKPRSGPLTDLLNPLMAIIVHPYLGEDAADHELSRPPAEPVRARARSRSHAALNPLEGLDTRLTYRTMRVLAVIEADPGLSNAEVSERAGIANQGQISKLLARLMRVGLIKNTGEGQARGASNAWRLTAKGREVRRAMARDPIATAADGG